MKFLFFLIPLLLMSCVSSSPFERISTPSFSEIEAVGIVPFKDEEAQELQVHITLKLTLEKAIALALRANRGLLSVEEQVDYSRLSLLAAKSKFEIKFKPKANAGFGKHSTDGIERKYGAGLTIDKRFESGSSLAVTPRVDRLDGGFQSGVDVSLRQPLFLGSNSEYNLSSVNSAEFSFRSSKRAVFLTQVHTVVTTVAMMYRVVQQRELVELNELSVSRLTGLVEATKAKENIGLATPIDVLRGEWQLGFALESLLTSSESLGESLDDLRFHLSLPLDQSIEVEAPLVYSPFDMNVNEAVAIALDNRVEIDQAYDVYMESLRYSRIAKHNTLPQLDLVFGYSQVGVNENLVNNFGLEDHVWNVNLVTTSDIARTAERAGFEQSLIRVTSAKRLFNMQQDGIAREVKRDVRNLKRAEKQIEIQTEQIKNSEASMRLSKIKFNHGLGDNFDLVEAEADLRQAEVDLVSAVVDFIVGNYRMRQSLGTLMESPEGI